MDNQHDFQAFYLKLQELVFKREKESTMKDLIKAKVFYYLSHNKNFEIKTIIEAITFIDDENDKRIEIGIKIIELQIDNISTTKSDLLVLIKEKYTSIVKIRQKSIKKFLINILIQNNDQLGTEAYFYEVLNVFLVDESIGIFELAIKLLIKTYKDKNCADYIKKNNILTKLFESIEKAKDKNFSILLTRELDLVLKLLTSKVDDLSTNSFLLSNNKESLKL